MKTMNAVFEGKHFNYTNKWMHCNGKMYVLPEAAMEEGRERKGGRRDGGRGAEDRTFADRGEERGAAAVRCRMRDGGENNLQTLFCLIVLLL
jgi:hypothetical protein